MISLLSFNHHYEGWGLLAESCRFSDLASRGLRRQDQLGSTPHAPPPALPLRQLPVAGGQLRAGLAGAHRHDGGARGVLGLLHPAQSSDFGFETCTGVGVSGFPRFLRPEYWDKPNLTDPRRPNLHGFAMSLRRALALAPCSDTDNCLGGSLSETN